MHHRILIKVNGNNPFDAQEMVKDTLEETLRCRSCESSRDGVNWDYIGDIMRITPTRLKKLKMESKKSRNPFWVWSTPEEMIESLEKKMREDSKARVRGHLYDTVLGQMKILTITKEEAPLHLEDESSGVQARVKKIFQGEEALNFNLGATPSTTDLSELVTSFLTNALEEQPYSMLSYYIEMVEKLAVIISGDHNNPRRLHCQDCHYYDMTDISAGKDVYYFWADRHF